MCLAGLREGRGASPGARLLGGRGAAGCGGGENTTKGCVKFMTGTVCVCVWGGGHECG